MRVVSESRTIDISYEQSIIYYDSISKNIQADYYYEGYVLKENVTLEEAKEILSEIRTAYTMGRKIYEIPEKG